MNKKKRPTGLLLALIFSVAVAPTFAAADAGGAYPADDPASVLKSFLHAMYSRDADVAYALLSEADRAVKTATEYAAESGRFDGAALRLARGLADAIRFGELKTVVEGDTARITFDALLPDANNPAIADLTLGFDRSRLASMTADEVAARTAAIRRLAEYGNLPTIKATDETWELVRVDGQWRVHINWAGAVEVRFAAVVDDKLGWEFAPTRGRVMAKPGETVAMSYRATNKGAVASTGKALHVVSPDGDARFLEVVSCFCFLEQTLAPGEAVELPLVLRVGFEAPETVRRLELRYEFYRADSFPRAGGGERGARG